MSIEYLLGDISVYMLFLYFGYEVCSTDLIVIIRTEQNSFCLFVFYYHLAAK